MGGVGGERLFEFDWEEEGVGAYSNKYGITTRENDLTSIAIWKP